MKTHHLCLLAQLHKTLLDYRDFYQKYGEHKELLQYVWEAIHATFPITSTSAIVNQLPTGEDGEVIEPSFFTWVKTHYLGLPKVKGIMDSSSEEEDEKQGQDQARKELTLVAKKAAQIYEW